jgi:hypothetical protein
MTAMSARLGAARFHWRAGRESRYPVCCIAHFCLDAIAGWQRAPCRDNPNDIDGVPGVVCGVFHSGASTLAIRSRLAEIMRWQRPALRAGLYSDSVGETSWAPDDATLWGPDHGAPGAGLDPELEWC